MNDDITSLIGLKSTDVLTCTQVTKNDVWYFYVTLVNHGARCQDCGTFSTKIKEYRKKEIDHAVLLNKKAKIIYNARRFTCPNCGKTFFEENPFTDPGDFTSQATIKNVLILLKEYNQTFASVARQVNLSKTEVMHIFDEHVQVKRKPLDESICLDEFYFSRKAKKKFALMILSFSHGNIIDILPSREKHSLHSYFHDIPIEERNLVRYVSIDMYDTYRDICRTMFPNALICVDSFHVMKWVSKALDDVRIRILHKYEDEYGGARGSLRRN
jgi:transposase